MRCNAKIGKESLTKIVAGCKASQCGHLRLFKQAFENSLTAMAILDSDFNFIYVNQKYAFADGHRVEDYLGRNHFEMYPSDAKEIFEKVVRTKKPHQVFSRPFVYANAPERGTTYWDWTLVPVLDECGQVELLLFSLNDVTKWRQAENELNRFFEVSPDLMCILGLPDFRFLRVNRAFGQVLGFAEYELLNRPCLAFVHPSDREAASNYLETLLTKETTRPLTVRFKSANGEFSLLTWNSVFVPEEGNTYAVLRDITEEERVQHEMVRLERMGLLGEMAAVIGHEVKNPITMVSAFLQLLSVKNEHPEHQKTLETAVRELERTAAIVARFASLAKDNPLNQQPKNLNDILTDLLPLLEACASEKDIQLSFDLNEVRELNLNREEVCQLVLNLIRNAIDATPTGGMVTIGTSTSNGKVILRVKDDGCGISPETLSRIGTPFFTTKENGTGLGMLVCKNIVKRHNAELKIEPQESGTLVSVVFT